MSKIESFLDNSSGLTVISISGDVTPKELLKCINHYYKGNRSNLVLWDFSDANFLGIEAELPKRAERKRNRWSRSGDRKAFVFPAPIKMDLKPLLEKYCQIQETQSNLDIFRNLIDANKWLLQAREAHR